MSSVKIIMYHYVRDFSRTRFPQIKGLDVSKFKLQIQELANSHQIFSLEELYQAHVSGESLPDNACVLTFDDGYLDHYTYVFPVLDELQVKASFFPVGEAIIERKLLDVNKIHFILSSVSNFERLVEAIDKEVVSNEIAKLYKEKYWIKNRFDSENVNYVKRMLQTGLPEGTRVKLTSELFSKYVTSDEASFAEELYLTVDQIKAMNRAGAHIGSHGWSHRWLETLSEFDIRSEVIKAKSFIQSLTNSNSILSICYPFGSYNESVVKIAKNEGYVIGLTTKPKIADLKKEDLLLLSRIDTNDV